MVIEQISMFNFQFDELTNLGFSNLTPSILGFPNLNPRMPGIYTGDVKYYILDDIIIQYTCEFTKRKRKNNKNVKIYKNVKNKWNLVLDYGFELHDFLSSNEYKFSIFSDCGYKYKHKSFKEYDIKTYIEENKTIFLDILANTQLNTYLIKFLFGDLIDVPIVNTKSARKI